MRRLALTLGLALAFQAHAQIPDDAVPAVLDTRINGVGEAQMATYWQKDGAWWAEPQQWLDLGLVLTDDEKRQDALSSSQLGVTLAIDEATQAAALKAPADRLPEQVKGMKKTLPELSKAAPGVLINYDAAAQLTREHQALSLAHDLRSSGAWGTLQTTGQVNWSSSKGAEFVRGLTRWNLDDYKRHVVWQAGDVQAGEAGTLLGGVRVAKDPSLDPYTPTWPLPTIGGVAVDPATIEILANQAKVAEHDVQVGNWTIERFPLSPGRNALDAVVRDRFGRTQIVSSSSFYLAPRLLRDGLTTWSVAAGAVRQGTTNNYKGTAAAIEFAHGASDRWTLTGSAQADGQHHHAKAGVRTVLGTAGTLELEAGKSSGQGSMVRGLYSYQGTNFGVQLAHEKTDQWWSLANNDAFAIQAKSRTQASLTWQSDDRRLRARLGGVDLATDRTRIRYVDAGVSFRQGDHTIAAGAQYDLRTRERTLAIGYRYNLDQGAITAHARQAPDVTRLALGGSYRTKLDGQPVAVQGELVDFNGDKQLRAAGHALLRNGEAHVSVDAGEQTRVAASWSGAVHLGRGGATWTPTINDGYAVVDVPGVANAPVKANGRVVGKTNDAGRVLVPQLSSLTPTRITVDSKALPPGVELESGEITVAPRRRAGALGQFKVLGTQARAFVLQRTTSIEPGARATTSNEEALVGYDGIVYLEKPEAGQAIEVVDGSGKCRAQLPDKLPSWTERPTLICQ